MRASFFRIAILAAIGAAAFHSSQAQSSIVSNTTSLPSQCNGSQETANQTLYVATRNKINVYTPGTTVPRLIITAGLAGVTQIATDKTGAVYASNFGTPNTYADSSVTQYARGATSPSLTSTDGAFSASGVAVDSLGDVFASSYYRNIISIYAPGGGHPSMQLQGGIVGPGLLAVANGRLYVGEAGSAQVLRFFPSGAPLSLQAPGTLPTGALTFGGPFVVRPNGILYAGGAVIANDLGFEEFVNIFPGGSTSPRTSMVISAGSNAQSPPFVAIAGNSLYVSASDINTVFQYSVDPALNLTLVRAITDGLNQPGPLAVDGSQCLYLGNACGQVTVYAPGGTTPSQTINLPDFGAPVAVTVAP